MKRKYTVYQYALMVFTMMVLAIMATAFFSCGDPADGKGHEPQKPGPQEPETEPRNPYNILEYQPRTEYNINIIDGEAALKQGAATAIYQYETGLPGGMIIVPGGELLKFHVTNSIAERPPSTGTASGSPMIRTDPR